MKALIEVDYDDDVGDEAELVEALESLGYVLSVNVDPVLTFTSDTELTVVTAWLDRAQVAVRPSIDRSFDYTTYLTREES